MKLFLPTVRWLLLLVLVIAPFTFGQTPVFTDEDLHREESIEDDVPVERVARVTIAEGDVSFLRDGVTEWAEAVENLPLFTGDQLYTARGGRAEIQLGRGNYIRLSENTTLTFTELSRTAAQFDLTEGGLIVRLEQYGKAFDRFEVDTPNAALVLQRDGLYRINVTGRDASELAVRTGLAEVETDDGLFAVREGHRLTVDTSPSGKLELAADFLRDDWDRWSSDRDTTIDRSYLSSSPTYVSSYETDNQSFYGASDLSDYGTWTNYSSYGYCWIPRVSSGWAPYRNGQWLWTPRYGWTWWSNEAWGWAPYHYGRWSYLNGIGWAWIPGFHSGFYRYDHSYYQWRPALVGFFNCPTSRGNYIGWYPLRPGERWYRQDRDRYDRERLRYPTIGGGSQRPRGDQDRWHRPTLREGSSVLPEDGFTRPDRTRSHPTAPDSDFDRWAKNGLRPGLPDVTPTTSVNAPVSRRADGRRALTPPRDVLSRPVVTHHRPTQTDTIGQSPRQRRVLMPRKDKTRLEFPAPTTRGHQHGDKTRDDETTDRARDKRTDANGEANNDSSRTRNRPQPGNTKGTNQNDSSKERKSDRDDQDSERHRRTDGAGQNGDPSERNKKRNDDVMYFPRTRGNADANDKPPDNTERRERPRNDNPNSNSGSNSGSHNGARPRNEEGNRSRDKGDSSPRTVEPRRPESRPERNKTEDRSQPRSEGSKRGKDKNNL